MHFAKTLGFLAGIAAATPALAHWQNTRFGMTVAEVRAATEGKAVDVNDAGKNGNGFRTLLSTPYDALGYSFTAYFMFGTGDDRLMTVQLRPNDMSVCDRLRGQLVTIYGEPVYSDHDRIALADQWRDEPGHNMVDYLMIGRNCTVSYRPIVARGSGL